MQNPDHLSYDEGRLRQTISLGMSRGDLVMAIEFFGNREIYRLWGEEIGARTMTVFQMIHQAERLAPLDSEKARSHLGDALVVVYDNRPSNRPNTRTFDPTEQVLFYEHIWKSKFLSDEGDDRKKLQQEWEGAIALMDDEFMKAYNHALYHSIVTKNPREFAAAYTQAVDAILPVTIYEDSPIGYKLSALSWLHKTARSLGVPSRSGELATFFQSLLQDVDGELMYTYVGTVPVTVWHGLREVMDDPDEADQYVEMTLAYLKDRVDTARLPDEASHASYEYNMVANQASAYYGVYGKVDDMVRVWDTIDGIQKEMVGRDILAYSYTHNIPFLRERLELGGFYPDELTYYLIMPRLLAEVDIRMLPLDAPMVQSLTERDDSLYLFYEKTRGFSHDDELRIIADEMMRDKIVALQRGEMDDDDILKLLGVLAQEKGKNHE